MKFLFAITHLNFWLPLDPVARKLCEEGHIVHVLIDQHRNRKFKRKYVFNSDQAPYRLSGMMPRSDGLQFILQSSRETINYIAYLKIRKPTSHLLVDRWAGYLPFPIRQFRHQPKFQKWLSSDTIWQRLRHIESVIGPDKKILKEVESFKPDVLVAASAIMPFSKEIEYVKAAKFLDIPTIVIIPSWDNLTTKGTLQIMPDWMFVWNRCQVKEASEFHFMPEERVFCTGAPRFDPWFDQLNPSLDRSLFCKQAGMNPEKKYLLYICSSEFIAGDETSFIQQLSYFLSRNPDPAISGLKILVRPHPLNLKFWEKYIPKTPNIVIWPKNLNVIDPIQSNHDFYHSIFYSIGVMGINTSAFIEAAIVDRPCIAIASDSFHLTQLGIPHFKHLLNAGFLELPINFKESAQIISDIVQGNDQKQIKRRMFVENFIRPNGIEKSAMEIMAQAIKNIAQGQKPSL